MSKALLRMKKVLDADDGGMDEDENGNQRWMVTLAKGWAFDGAAAKYEDDPDGAYASHSRGGTVREMQDRIKYAQPCRCGRCLSV